jgi:hypothetical protein
MATCVKTGAAVEEFAGGKLVYTDDNIVQTRLIPLPAM